MQYLLSYTVKKIFSKIPNDHFRNKAFKNLCYKLSCLFK